MDELHQLFERIHLLFDACDRWLRDADDPTRYDIGPRAEDIKVIYLENGANGKPVKRKARLSHLLEQVDQAKKDNGYSLLMVESKHADPRDLVLKTADRLQQQIELLARLMGELQDQPGATVNVLVASSDWLRLRALILDCLEPYPEARLAIVAVLTQEEEHVVIG